MQAKRRESQCFSNLQISVSKDSDFYWGPAWQDRCIFHDNLSSHEFSTYSTIPVHTCCLLAKNTSLFVWPSSIQFTASDIENCTMHLFKAMPNTSYRNSRLGGTISTCTPQMLSGGRVLSPLSPAKMCVSMRQMQNLKCQM